MMIKAEKTIKINKTSFKFQLPTKVKKRKRNNKHTINLSIYDLMYDSNKAVDVVAEAPVPR